MRDKSANSWTGGRLDEAFSPRGVQTATWAGVRAIKKQTAYVDHIGYPARPIWNVDTHAIPLSEVRQKNTTHLSAFA